MLSLKLFLVFFKVGLFAIGGAYSFIPLLERELVDNYHWLSKKEFLDILGIVKLFPGAISIKYATYTGYKIAGISGFIAANLGNLLAPALLIFIAAKIYMKYQNLPRIKSAFNNIQLAVFAMLLIIAFELIDIRTLGYWRYLIIVLASAILFLYKIHPALIILVMGFIGWLWIK